MGILDDAIRQHLDLKRRLGADDDELKRLEDEAFGPPSRPGDPDFPDSDSGGEASTAEPVAAEGVAVEERPRSETSDDSPPPDAQDSEADEQGSDADGQAEGGSPFYDQTEEELDLELDLEFEDEPEVTPAPPAASEPPIESLDTVEHPYEDALEEAGEGERAEEHTDEQEVVDEDEEEPLEGELVDEGGDREADEDDGDDEDVLEETPEFLRDAPEDDELWFEQGKPKDFDF